MPHNWVTRDSGARRRSPHTQRRSGVSPIWVARRAGSTARNWASSATPVVGQTAGAQQALIRGLGGVIPAHAFAPDAASVQDFSERAEEVQLHPKQRIQAFEQPQGDVGAVPITADESAHREPVAELDPGLIVLPVLPAPRDADTMLPTVVEERAVEEFTAIVGVPLAQPDGQPLVNVVDAGPHASGADAPDRLELDPTAGHVHGHEAAEVKAFGGLATVQHQIALHSPGPAPRPVAPRPDRDLLLQSVRGQ